MSLLIFSKFNHKRKTKKQNTGEDNDYKKNNNNDLQTSKFSKRRERKSKTF